MDAGPATAQRPVAGLPSKSRDTKPKSALKLPVVAPYTNGADVSRALQTNDAASLTAALVQLEKRCNALVFKPAPRAQADAVLEYIAQNEGAQHVFDAWQLAHKTNNSQLSTAVLNALSGLLRVISTDPFARDPPLLKRLLASSSPYGDYLDRGLNPGRNDVTVAALKLCNIVVGYGNGRFARRLFLSLAWSPKITSRLYKTRLRDTSRDPLLKPDIRTLLLVLVLGFLGANDSKLKTLVVEARGLLSGLLKGLSEDPPVVVNHVLFCLWRDLMSDRSVPLDSRRSILDEGCINELVKLYDASDSTDEDVPNPSESVHRLLYTITDWLAEQIDAAPSRSFGAQKTLGLVLKALKVTEDAEQRQLGLYVLERAPTLATSFWSKFPSSLDPRLSSRWISAITFATQVVALPVPSTIELSVDAQASSIATTTSTAPPTLSSLLDTALAPTLNKAWYSKALQHETPLVSFLSSILLLASLQKLAKILESVARVSTSLEEATGGRWANLAERMRRHLKTVLPDPQIVVALMQKTASNAATSASASSSSKKRKSSVMDVEQEVTAASTEADQAAAVSTAHLRTNVALRLLWLYHRVCPSLILTLKFDFTKLPQAHVDKSDAEGVRAISSSYALRLAAMHSASLTWSKPGEHFKTTLQPLFNLLRSPLAPSNQQLLRGILARLLSTPLLFGDAGSGGTGPDEQAASQVYVWLDALPDSDYEGSGESVDRISAPLALLEQAIQKTLTAPISAAKTSAGTTDVTRSLGPLFETFVELLARGTDGHDSSNDEVDSYVRRVFVGLVGQCSSVEQIEYARDALIRAIVSRAADKSAEAVGFLKDCVEALHGRAEGSKRAEGLNTWSEANPVQANVFASFEEEENAAESLAAAIHSMPLELVALHVRPSDPERDNVYSLIASAAIGRSARSQLAAVQVLVHRLLCAPETWSASDLGRVILLAEQFVEGVADVKWQRQAKQTLYGSEGLAKNVLNAEPREHLYEVSIASIARLLRPTDKHDLALAEPFSRLVSNVLSNASASSVSAPTSKKSKKKDRRSSHLASASPSKYSWILSSTPLIPFLDAASSRAVLDAVLVQTSVEAVPQIDAGTLAKLEAALQRASSVQGLEELWAKHFALLLKLNKAGVQSAGAMLVSGSSRLVPFGRTVGLDNAGKLSDDIWRPYVKAWTSELLNGCPMNPTNAQIVSSLAVRSKAARRLFQEWLSAHQNDTEGIHSARTAVRMLAQIASSGAEASVPASVVQSLLRTSLEGCTVDKDTLEIVQVANAETRSILKQDLERHLESLGRDEYSAAVLRFASVLELSERAVNGCLEGLTRRFAEDETLSQNTLDLVRELDLVASSGRIAFKGHLLDTLVTAAIQFKLVVPEVTRVIARLVPGHAWKDNDITRHLNAIFANSAFSPRPLETVDGNADRQSPILNLIVALSRASLASAAANKVVDPLVPFYGGTLAQRDQTLLDLFFRIEVVSQKSLSVSFKAWNPLLDGAPSDNSRVSALANLQADAVHRACLKAFASGKTPFAPEDLATTYDPAFLVAFVRHVIAEDQLKPQEWTTLLESGSLGVVFAGLASSRADVRLNSRATLSLALLKLGSSNIKERDEAVLILTHARNCIASAAGEPIPALTALFLSHAMRAIGTPSSTMYPSFVRFLLQRPTLDQRDVPMLYQMFYSTSDVPIEDRKWLIGFLTDGLVRSQDWKILRRRQTFELLASLFQSSKPGSDEGLRKLVLKFIERASTIPAAARELLSRNGVLSFLASQRFVPGLETSLVASVLKHLVSHVSDSKLAAIAEAADAVLVFTQASEGMSPADLSDISACVLSLVSKIPPSGTSSVPDAMLELVFTRLRAVLMLVKAQLDAQTSESDRDAAGIAFSGAVVSFVFSLSRTGQVETSEDQILFQRALKGLASAVDESSEVVKAFRRDVLGVLARMA